MFPCGSGYDDNTEELTWFADQVVGSQEDFTCCERNTETHGQFVTIHINDLFISVIRDIWHQGHYLLSVEDFSYACASEKGRAKPIILKLPACFVLSANKVVNIKLRNQVGLD